MKKDNKTIAITLRFYTNDLQVTHPTSGWIESLACWDSGNTQLEANKEKGISANDTQFQCYEDIIPAIKELFRKAKIVVVSNNRRPRILNSKRKKW